MINTRTKYSPTVKAHFFNRWTSLIGGAFLLFWVILYGAIFYSGHWAQGAATSNSLAALIPIKQTFAFRGSLMAQTNKNFVQAITFIVAQGADGVPINLAGNAIVIDYRDANQRLHALTWRAEFLEPHDQDMLLEAGELVRFTVPLTESLVHPLTPNRAFVLDIIPETGTLLTLKSKTPPQFDTNTQLTLR